MRDKAGVDQKVSDAGLIAWFCQMQEETEAHGEWNDATKFGTQVFTGLERVKVRGGGSTEEIHQTGRECCLQIAKTSLKGERIAEVTGSLSRCNR